MKPVCTACQRQVTIKKTGTNVVETYGPTRRPEKVWRADVFACRGCGVELLVNFASYPIAERHRQGFDQLLAELPHDPDGVYYVHEFPAQAVAAGVRG